MFTHVSDILKELGMNNSSLSLTLLRNNVRIKTTNEENVGPPPSLLHPAPAYVVTVNTM